MTCPLELPNCKRKLMTSNKPFEKKLCPLNIKPECSLSPPACPLLPQKETKCGYAKLMGEDVAVNQCPCKTCFLAEGCPVSVNPCPNLCTDGTDKSAAAKWPDKIPPCPTCFDSNTATEPVPPSKPVEKVEKTQPYKTTIKSPNSQIVRKCSLISSPRPLPCSDCILQDLSADTKSDRNSKSCPYLLLPNVCGKNCYCPDVPSVETGPLCPFAPKPCPCCVTPRCPLSRKPDCILQPKPACCLQSSKCGICIPSKCPSFPCSCGLCCNVPCCKPLCGICLPGPIPCPPNTSCPLKPDCGPCPFINPCNPCPPVNPCDPCPPVNPCSPCLTSCCPSMLCSCSQPSCPLVNPCNPCSPCLTSCCPSMLCTCSQPSCPLVNPCNPCFPLSCCSTLCTCSQPSCPLVNPCCDPSIPCLGLCCSSPSCITCLLKKIQCSLNPCSCSIKSICPPIPPPCSLKSDLSDPSDVPKEKVERTFHLPTCPSYEPPCGAHLSLKDQCPFSPNPCPIGCECPFPVSMSMMGELKDPQEKNLKEESHKNQFQDNRSSSKSVKFNDYVKDEIIVGNSEKVVPDESSQCPAKCGSTPLPTCPAAEILCPDIYIKPKKVEKKPCPFKKCMKKQGCPLSELKPLVDCKISNCPMTKEPDCPLGELVNRCRRFPKCSGPCLCPPVGCCSVPLPCPLNVPCECTDGRSRSFSLSSSVDSTLLSSSSSTYTLSSLSKSDYQDSAQRKSNGQMSTLKKMSSSSLSLNGEKLVFDGCCCQNNKKNKSQDFSESDVSSECPFEPLAPKRICKFAPPKCPLTPKPKSCPLTRKPDPCALSLGGQLLCPVKYPPCKKFPSGRCPMGNINTCDCEYPVSPCLLPLQDNDVVAPPQYCFREDCCMGLPFPPSVLKTAEGEIEKGPFYQFKDTKPGKEETKHYVKISKKPLDGTISLFGLPKERVHNNWTIVKHGEGYRRCKTIAKKLKNMGPIRNFDSQYDPEDCPLDEETIMIMENRKKHERDLKELETLRMSLV